MPAHVLSGGPTHCLEGAVPTCIGEKLWSQRGLVLTVEDAAGACRALRLDTPFARVGSDPRAELVLSGAGIQPCHLYLHATEEGIYCLGLSNRAPTGWLSPKLRIEIGGFRIKAGFNDDGPPPRKFDYDPRAKDCIGDSNPRLRLRVTGHQKQAFEMNLRRQLTIVGRQPPSSLCVQHPTVSRTHAVLFWDGRSLWTIDLLSANGIRRDGEPLEAGALAVSQRLAVGDVRCRYLGARNSAAAPRAVNDSASGAPLKKEIAALREALAEKTSAFTVARELAEELAAQHERALAEAQQDLAASHEQQAELQAAADGRLAALRESLSLELAEAAAAREAAETVAAKSALALIESSENLHRLQAELAASQQELAASREQQTELQAAADGRLAALRESLARELAEAVAAREAADEAAAKSTLALTEFSENLHRVRAELQASADDRLAALRESWAQELTEAVAAREAAEKMAAKSTLALTESSENLHRLQAELAASQQDLAASREQQAELQAAADDRLAALRESLARELAEAVAARESAENALAQREASLAELDQLSESAVEAPDRGDSPPATEADWVLDDRVIGRLLDFRARERATGTRRKILWSVAACLTILVLGAAAAASRAWSAHRQPTDAPAAADAEDLIREAFIKRGLR